LVLWGDSVKSRQEVYRKQLVDRGGLTFVNFLHCLPAKLTNSGKFDVVAKDCVGGRLGGILVDLVLNGDVYIIYSIALAAADVIMTFRGSIKAFLRAADFDFEDNAAVRHEFKISINRPQTYSWETFADHVIYFIGRWVGGYFVKFL